MLQCCCRGRRLQSMRKSLANARVCVAQTKMTAVTLHLYNAIDNPIKTCHFFCHTIFRGEPSNRKSVEKLHCSRIFNIFLISSHSRPFSLVVPLSPSLVEPNSIRSENENWKSKNHRSNSVWMTWVWLTFLSYIWQAVHIAMMIYIFVARQCLAAIITHSYRERERLKYDLNSKTHSIWWIVRAFGTTSAMHNNLKKLWLQHDLPLFY